jgi:hypothetical protein
MRGCRLVCILTVLKVSFDLVLPALSCCGSLAQRYPVQVRPRPPPVPGQQQGGKQPKRSKPGVKGAKGGKLAPGTPCMSPYSGFFPRPCLIVFAPASYSTQRTGRQEGRGARHARSLL